MYDFKIEAADKATLYRDLVQAMEALIGDETDAIANMANASGLIYETLPDVNWVGFDNYDEFLFQGLASRDNIAATLRTLQFSAAVTVIQFT